MGFRKVAAAGLVTILASGCSMIPLLQAMLGTRKPNRMIAGQLFANGGGGHAKLGGDGISRIVVLRNPKETIFRPSLILMQRPGDLEITFSNNDPQAHLLIAAQSDGGQQVLDLAPLQAGRAKIHYGSPGLYLVADAMANEMGQGMLAFVLVEGEVPSSAKLDRPPQKRP